MVLARARSRPALGPHIPVPHLRQMLRFRLWPHAGALLRHTGFGNTIYGATIPPSVTFSTARDALLQSGKAPIKIEPLH
jgi:hypothetical protein